MKKAISVLLCFVFAFGILPATAFAEESDGFSHVTGSNLSECLKAVTEGVDYKLSEDGKTVTVNTADGYCKAVIISNASGSVIEKLVLNSNIDLESIALRPITPQNSSKTYEIEGNGHTVKGFYTTMGYDKTYYSGLVSTANYLTVRNLTVEDSQIITGRNGVAVIAGNVNASGVFENITVRNCVARGYGKVGTVLGLCASNSGCDIVFKNITAENNTVMAVYNAGGVAGLLKRLNTLTYENINVINDTFEPIETDANTWVTLNTEVTCDGTYRTCIGEGVKIHGYYWDWAKTNNINYNYYYFGGYGRYWVMYGETAHDCNAVGIGSYQIGNSELVVNSLDGHEHNEDSFTLVPGKKATCVSEGVSDYYICECGIKLLKSGDYEYGYMEFWSDSALVLPVDPDNHTGNTVTKDYVAPTCTENGYTGDIYCADCGELIEKGEEIPAINHANTETVGATEPTCSEPGYTGNIYCSDCHIFLSAGELIPYLGKDAPVEAHKHIETVPAAEPTCTQPGSTESKICADCGAVIVPGEEIPATGVHTDEDGDDVCDVCGEQLGEPAPTEPATGMSAFRCKMCKKYETHKDIPVIGLFYRLVHFFVHLGHYIGYIT